MIYLNRNNTNFFTNDTNICVNLWNLWENYLLRLLCHFIPRNDKEYQLKTYFQYTKTPTTTEAAVIKRTAPAEISLIKPILLSNSG